MRNLKHISSGYLVEDGKILLIYHDKQNQWVPSGGHLEENETHQMALIREMKEELGIDIDVLDAFGKSPFEDQGIWKNEPRPFYCDFEDMSATSYDHDMYVQIYFVRRKDKSQEPKMIEGMKKFQWFSEDEIRNLDTYEQVKALALYALYNHPECK